MKIKDIQFVNNFLTNEIKLDLLLEQILEKEIEVISSSDNSNIIANTESKIIYKNPSSIIVFLFNILHTILKPYIPQVVQDKVGIGLLLRCKEYVHHNKKDIDNIPIFISFDKFFIPSAIVREIVEPVLGQKLDLNTILLMPCNFTDTCRIVESLNQLKNEYKTPMQNVGYHDFPLVLCNSSIQNDAAQAVGMTVKCLEYTIGEKKTEKVIRNILLGPDLISHTILILETLNGDPEFILDFLEMLESHIGLSLDEHNIATELQYKNIQASKYLEEHIKTAQTPQVWKQWYQWSMLMGLIEKQLEPMRGSSWPASERIKPHEDRLRLIIKDRAKKKNKNQANFEEMLEAARDLYNHNAVEPGKLIEIMLKDERVWPQLI